MMLHRVLLAGSLFVSPYNMGTLHEIYNIYSYQPMTLARWTNFFFEMVKHPSFAPSIRSGVIHDVEEFLQDPRFLGLTSLRYVSVRERLSGKNDTGWKLIYEKNVPPARYVYENIHALPRAYLVGNYIITRDEQESFQAIRDNISRMSNMAILKNGSPSFDSDDVYVNPGTVTIREYNINGVDLDIEAAAGLLVLTDSYFPGWNAYMDGIKIPVWRANSLFRAIEVPRGSHRVTFRYQPASLRWGIAVSLGTLILVIAGIAVDRRLAGKKMNLPASELPASSADD
jgi:hypothetical protein